MTRVCTHEGCITILRSTNPGPECSIHGRPRILPPLEVTIGLDTALAKYRECPCGRVVLARYMEAGLCRVCRTVILPLERAVGLREIKLRVKALAA